MLAHVRALSEKIGPRGTGTPAEQKAASYVVDKLRGLGIKPELLTCRTISSMNHYPISISIMGLVGVVLYFFPFSTLRWIGTILALLVAPFMALTVRTSSNPLRLFLPKVNSPSVLARVYPRDKMTGQIVLLAHLDSNKSRLTWKPENLHRLEKLTYFTLCVQASLGLLYLVGNFLSQYKIIWMLSLLPGLYMLAMIITLVIDDKCPYSPGANDNASSVSVVLELAKHLTHQPLKNTRVWIAFTGAEETDHFGLRSILKSNAGDMREALFIDLEGVGGGEIIFVSRHGIGLHYYPDRFLFTLAQRVSRANPDLKVHSEIMVMAEEVSTLTLFAHRAICIAGRDPKTGGLPHWHQADDVWQAVDPQVLAKAYAFTFALIKAIDQQ